MSTALGVEMKTTLLPTVADKDVQRVADALSNVSADTFILILRRTIFIGMSLGQCLVRCIGCLRSNTTNCGWPLMQSPNVFARWSSWRPDHMENLPSLHISRRRRPQRTPPK